VAFSGYFSRNYPHAQIIVIPSIDGYGWALKLRPLDNNPPAFFKTSLIGSYGGAGFLINVSNLK